MEKKKNKKYLTGIVQNVSGKKSVKVRVESKFPHPKYGKTVKSHKSYIVHVEDENSVVKGDVVLIEPCRPVSKLKSWTLVKKVDSKK